MAGPIAVLKEYERGVLYTLGKYAGLKGPGVVLVAPLVQNLVVVDMRKRKMITSIDVIPSDNLALKVDAEIHFRVEDPAKAINNVADYKAAMAEEAARLLHAAAAGRKRDEILSSLETIAPALGTPLDAKTRAWGIGVSAVDLRKASGNSFGETNSVNT